MTNLNSILKSRDITFVTKILKVKAMVFPVVIYRWESWTIKKAECWRIDAFELWGWRRLESPLGCKEIQPVHPKGDQSWIFIGRTDAKAEAPILWHLMRRTDSLEKTLMLRKIEGRRWRRWQRMRWSNGITDSMGHESEQAPEVGDGQGSLACCSPWVAKSWTQLKDRTKLCICANYFNFPKLSFIYKIMSIRSPLKVYSEASRI